MSRTVISTGRGTAKLPPDTATLHLWLRAKHPDYNDATKALLKDTILVEEAARGTGIDVQVKGEDTHVDACYEYRKDITGNQKRVLVGYEARRCLLVTVPNKGANVIAVQLALQKCGVTPEMTVHYSLKDESAAEKLALEKACKDAREKAEVMCAASGVKLGQLVSVSNSAPVAAMPVAPAMLRSAPMKLAMDEAPAPVEAEDIEVSVEATLVFEIE